MHEQPYAGQQVTVKNHPEQPGIVTSIDRYDNATVRFPRLDTNLTYHIEELEFQETFGLDGAGI